MNKKKILVADDDTAILDALTFMLEDAGYAVKTTTDGQTEQLVRDYLPDLILLDIWMAGSDGRTICRNIRHQKTIKDIPIIIISANRDTKKIAKKVGADDYMDKPFDMDNLLAMVEKYVK